MTAKGESGMDTIAGPTPRPWTVREIQRGWRCGLSFVARGYEINGPLYPVFAMSSDGRVEPSAKEDAELICLAVNCHDDLVAACEAALLAIRSQTYTGQVLAEQKLNAALSKARQP